ncbi:nucleotide exchange factor GrpE [Flexithrix dorotheae]|uniref:nucleotide exchange factor GrpE n=1 Tax=Flexithrix dorotheae TaxID=70993 RepID=UPI000370302D|nr:nucleotide exchange factor GrpE [Flexithrix dorotheae]
MGKDKEKDQKETQQDTEVVNEKEEVSEQTEPNTASNESDSTSENQTVEEELSESEKHAIELAEAKDKYLRLYSEFENYRRRTSKEKMDFLKTANEGLIKEFLPILDDFERAQNSFGEEVKENDPVREGFEIIYKKFKTTLDKQGLVEIENPQGKEFDTELHEAVTQFPAPSEDLKGKVIDQVEKGYILGEKVIRFAKVVVGA